MPLWLTCRRSAAQRSARGRRAKHDEHGGGGGDGGPAGEDDLTQTVPAACPQPLHGHSQIVVLGRKVGLCASGRGAGGWWGSGES